MNVLGFFIPVFLGVNFLSSFDFFNISLIIIIIIIIT